MIKPLPPPVVRVLLAGERRAALTIAMERREHVTATGGVVTGARARKYVGLAVAQARAARVVADRFADITRK